MENSARHYMGSWSKKRTHTHSKTNFLPLYLPRKGPKFKKKEKAKTVACKVMPNPSCCVSMLPSHHAFSTLFLVQLALCRRHVLIRPQAIIQPPLLRKSNFDII